jgi:hypothetical protein
MCRVGDYRKDECKIQWFDPEDEPLDTLGEKTDLVLKNANFDDHMGVYKCEICCHNQCRTLTSFVYPVRIFSKKTDLLILIILLFIRLEQTNRTTNCEYTYIYCYSNNEKRSSCLLLYKISCKLGV